ncbi:MAG: fumarate hydratase C-terminal domain-containing protein, partial [Gemmatimonadota bacterium]|nr:fumarate hydratase C-terminal domain-containing protein [Gemmatimonadota bacterium]
MDKIISLAPPLSDKMVLGLRAGDRVSLNGVLYTARDAAHKRLVALLEEGKELPFDIRGQIIYYVGPTPARPGRVIGSAGPTTSYRMDAYAPRLLEQGLKGMIGKGNRGPEVLEAMQREKAVYLA